MDWFSNLVQEKPKPVCDKGDFIFAAIGLEHGHINNMCSKLIEAGGVLKWVYDNDLKKLDAFIKKFPTCSIAKSQQEIMQDSEVHMVVSAAVPSERYKIGIKTMEHEKDFFTAETPFTQLSQLEQVNQVIKQTKRKYAVNYSERVSDESAIFAGRLLECGAIGRVVQVLGMGPHRLNLPSRPDWFFY